MTHLVQANAVTIPLADNSVHMCVTSLPYWALRNYQVDGQLGLESKADCGRPYVRLRDDLTEKQYQFVLSRLEEEGLI